MFFARSARPDSPAQKEPAFPTNCLHTLITRGSAAQRHQPKKTSQVRAGRGPGEPVRFDALEHAAGPRVGKRKLRLFISLWRAACHQQRFNYPDGQ